MGGLSALLAVFAGLYFSQRKKLKGLSSPPPASPVSQTQAPDPATVSEPAPAPEPDPVIPAAAVAATGAAAAGAASSAPAAPAAPAPSAFLSNVKSIIQSHVSDPSFGVEELAAAMGISRIHLNRKLQADSNTSPSALLKEARMTLAAESLLKGEESIADIAARSGFSTPSYFSTAFKDYFGMTPSEYISKNS